MYGRSSEPNQPVPMRYPHLLFALLCVLGLRTVSHAQLTLLNSFDPANAGGFCGLAYDADSARIWAYDCDVAVIYQYTTAGVFVRSIPMVGGTSNDVDLTMSPEALNLGAGSVPAGRLMVFNGETGPCEVYGVNQGPGTVLATLNSAFGASHVVGGAYHPIRNTIYMVQDDQPVAATDNLIAEIDPVTGAVLNQFDLITSYNVGYGDLEISPVTGQLFVVSGDEETIIQYTPDGAPTEEFQLPTGVTNISGLALDCASGQAWVCNTSGFIYRLGGFPCGNLIGENTALTCADGVDNDADGVIDCDDAGCRALNGNIGCSTCFTDGLSFADAALDYFNNCGGNTRTDSSMALGMPDFIDASDLGIVSLGNGGHLNLLFTNNTLTNSGTSDADLFVFEVGELVEASTIELRPLDVSTTNALIAAGKVDADLDGYYEFGGIGGATASVDIDASVPGAASGTLFFDAIQIVDVPDGCSGATPGADIDAVCALSSIPCTIGGPCDDGEACTTGDIYDVACACAGTFADADGDGTCDANDLCPGGPEPGAACDDGNVDTFADAISTGCTCTGTPRIRVSARVFLEGPYSNATGLMSDALRTVPAFPLNDPYPGLGYTHVGAGTGSIAPVVLSTTGNDAVVDWVILELRSSAAPSSIVASRSVVLQRDGHVVDLDGSSSVGFAVVAGNYHVAVRHRNHLGAMTALPIALSSTTTPVDLTTSATTTYGTQARKSIPGTFPAEVLWAGDATFNAATKYTGSGNDRDPILVTVGSSTPNNVVANAYSSRDVNMNGQVKYTGSGNDRDPILVNVGSTTPNSTRAQQLP